LKRSDPGWLLHSQMMRMAVTTHSLPKRLHGWERFRPYNFFFVPILANCGYPANIDPNHFTLIAPFEKDQSKWIDSVYINIDDLNDRKQYRALSLPSRIEEPCLEWRNPARTSKARV
jgi:hypothetical protein